MFQCLCVCFGEGLGEAIVRKLSSFGQSVCLNPLSPPLSGVRGGGCVTAGAASRRGLRHGGRGLHHGGGCVTAGSASRRAGAASL